MKEKNKDEEGEEQQQRRTMKIEEQYLIRMTTSETNNEDGEGQRWIGTTATAKRTSAKRPNKIQYLPVNFFFKMIVTMTYYFVHRC